MYLDGFIWQIFSGLLITIKLAVCALFVGMIVGLLGALIESIQQRWLRYLAGSLIFLVRGLPELLVLFFIYFGLTSMLSQLFHRYVDISAFMAGVIALGLIFGAYASSVFRGAFMAIDRGQLDAGEALGFSRMQIVLYIQIPQAWRHAIPGWGNLWLVLIKDTAIVS
jgi:His/Glu/Gln/Arg/opine family amino acid ABC transporter permease subunit